MAKDDDGDPPKRALTRANALEHPVALAKEQKLLLQEALIEGAKTVDTMESAIVEYGRWLLLHVFEDDSAVALDDRTGNPVWLELLRRAGGPTLKLNGKSLNVAIRIAAHDRRITSETFRSLDYHRKELLLPLRDDARLVEAAKHVSSLKLSQNATQSYVDELRKAGGKPPEPRLTPARLLARVNATRARLAVPKGKKHIEKLAAELSKEQRAELNAAIRALIDDARELAVLLRSSR